MRNSGAQHWKLQFGEGVVLVLLGIAAVFVPFGLGITLLVWLLLFGGIAGLITTLAMPQATGFWWSLLSASMAVGIALSVFAIAFAVPELALVAFPVFLITFLIAEGALTIAFALEHWRDRSARWNWMLASGFVDLSLAAFIMFGPPAIARWALGLILAVNLTFGGGATIAMALAARDRAADANL